MCLILVGLFFARKLYRMNLLTIGDYYRARYNRTVEVLTSLCIVTSYLGWVAAQITALGLVFNVLTQGAISHAEGMLIGAAIVLVYTLFGGMWSVAMTDFFQMTIIVVGMLYIGYVISGIAGGAGMVLKHAAACRQIRILAGAQHARRPGLRRRLGHHDVRLDPAAGRVPARDVGAQRKHRGARRGRWAAACISCSPSSRMFLAYSATLIDPGWCRH